MSKDDSYLTLVEVADLLLVETSQRTFEKCVLPLLLDKKEFATPLLRLDTQCVRYCHPQPEELARELECLDEQLALLREDLPNREQPHSGQVDRQDLSASDLQNWRLTVRSGGELAARLNSWTLCMHLLELSITVVSENPRQARELAELALTLARRVEGYGWHRPSLEALAWAHIANAYRVPGHLRLAQECMAEVESRRPKLDMDLPGLWGHIELLRGCLLRDQRQFDASRRALLEGIRLAEQASRAIVKARCLMNLASLDYEAGEPEQALATTREALAHIDAEQYPRWHAEGAVNLASYLNRAGDPEGALIQLGAALPTLREHGSPAGLLRAVWSEATALRTLGRYELAIDRFDTARRGFLGMERGYDAALTTLELAVLHLEQGHTSEVKRLAVEILPVFEMQGIDREARATLELFRQAAMAEQVTVLQLRSWLERLTGQA